ncbi:MAG: hypothetical protein K2P51_06720 [Rhabdochlamydiaceae bacterium]|nr:hypothetical protein [Rhabdochlamydiaceae bacterium]
MKKGLYEVIKGVVLSSTLAVMVMMNPLSAGSGSEIARKETKIDANALVSWQDFHSTAGKCKMKFPKYPDHLSEKLRLPEEGFDLKYDAYISALDQKTVFMLLIAQYPDFVDEAYARMSLEGFLNGVLTHNPNNQLIFADLSLVDGHQALDFFIRTGGVYFKGRALMVKNSLYLMAMECEVQNYDETHYNAFVDSFQLSK